MLQFRPVRRQDRLRPPAAALRQDEAVLLRQARQKLAGAFDPHERRGARQQDNPSVFGDNQAVSGAAQPPPRPVGDTRAHARRGFGGREAESPQNHSPSVGGLFGGGLAPRGSLA